MSSSDTSPTPEERLRLLLTEAVEPVQPGPGAEARLQAKIRAGRRERDLPKRLRWAGAALGAAAVVAGGVLVVTQTGRDDGSSASSAAEAESSPASGTSSPEAAPAAAPAASPGALSYGSNAPDLRAGPESAPTADLGGTTSEQQKDAGSAAGASQLSGGVAGAKAAPLNPLGAAVTPSDLNGDGSPDQLTVSGQQLVVTFRSGTQNVTLPQVSAGARVLGVTQLQDAAGALVRVAFIRLGADSAHARDTLVAVVGGKLTVLGLGGQPVVLAVTATQGYTCDGALVVTAAKITGYTVNGGNLIPSGSVRGVAKPGSNCTFS